MRGNPLKGNLSALGGKVYEDSLDQKLFHRVNHPFIRLPTQFQQQHHPFQLFQSLHSLHVPLLLESDVSFPFCHGHT